MVGVYFAVRAFGDGAALSDLSAPLLATAACPVQVLAIIDSYNLLLIHASRRPTST
jgi:hypothetical protein